MSCNEPTLTITESEAIQVLQGQITFSQLLTIRGWSMVARKERDHLIERLYNGGHSACLSGECQRLRRHAARMLEADQ